MDTEMRKRLRWVQLYEEIGNAGVACLKCGSRVQRYGNGAGAIKSWE